MASFREHISQANSNLIFLGKTNEFCRNHWDWQVTVCYYVAVHYVNAHLADKIDEHYRSHQLTEDAISPNSKSKARTDDATWVAYKTLRNLSRRARYLIHEDRGDKSTEFHLTVDKHLRKAIRNLDQLLTYFSNEYKIDIEKIPLYCMEFKHTDEFKFFIKNK